jgi:hypothetical protein
MERERPEEVELAAGASGQIPPSARSSLFGGISGPSWLILVGCFAVAALRASHQRQDWEQTSERLRFLEELLRQRGDMLADHLHDIAAGMPVLRRVGW